MLFKKCFFTFCWLCVLTGPAPADLQPVIASAQTVQPAIKTDVAQTIPNRAEELFPNLGQ